MDSWIGVAVIVDLVNSRDLVDRRSVQTNLQSSLDDVNALVPSLQPFAPTVGDEFQAVFATPSAALTGVLFAQLARPDAVDLRFGLAHGALWEVGRGVSGAVQDGPAWWLAREAIDEARAREKSRTPSARSWFRAASPAEPPPGGVPLAGLSHVSDGSVKAELPGAQLKPRTVVHADLTPMEPLINSYLLVRDHLVTSMTPRARRLALGLCLGRTQGQLAADEGISQSAVSQSLRRSGASNIALGLDALAGWDA